jgi:hypothetical protein
LCQGTDFSRAEKIAQDLYGRRAVAEIGAFPLREILNGFGGCLLHRTDAGRGVRVWRRLRPAACIQTKPSRNGIEKDLAFFIS